MTSLRPLATIALLAAVGGFLYMKINESEPKLSPELQEWSTATLDIGLDAESAATSSVATTPPVVSATPATPGQGAGGDAPAYVSAQLNPLPAAPPARTPSAGGAAPTWSPEAAGAMSDSSPTPRPAETMPALPVMPGGGDAGDAQISANPMPDAPAEVAIEAAPTAPLVDRPSMFAQARVAAQGALDRGELAQALSILSEWYGDPSLTPAEASELNELLSQLAGSVIYQGPPAHRLLPEHVVAAGETLESIAAKYDVPWQLLAKINGVSSPAALMPGHALKVLPGPFSALIDLSERRMTLMLDRRYAGRFELEIEPTASIEEGEWKVDQKLLTPAGGGLYGLPGDATEDRSLLLANLANPAGASAIVRGPGNPDPASASPRDRVLRMKAADVADIYDILSEGSRITIRR